MVNSSIFRILKFLKKVSMLSLRARISLPMTMVIQRCQGRRMKRARHILMLVRQCWEVILTDILYYHLIRFQMIKRMLHHQAITWHVLLEVTVRVEFLSAKMLMVTHSSRLLSTRKRLIRVLMLVSPLKLSLSMLERKVMYLAMVSRVGMSRETEL